MQLHDLSHEPEALTLTWAEGRTTRYPTLWLRDNIPSGRHRDEGQRTFDINQLPVAMSITGATIVEGGVRVRFSDVEDTFPLSFLLNHDLAGQPAEPPMVPWGAGLQDGIEFVDYRRLASDDRERLRWLTHLRDYGFALISGLPAAEEAVFDAVDLFGFVRETNYGRLFDVIVRSDPANLANTSAEIGMHTDNPYRDPVPGLQLLHCIVNETDGGQSQLCDGFAVAEQLRIKDPGAFELLSRHPVRFRFLDAGSADLECIRPMIETDVTGAVVGIRYNSRSVAAFDLDSDVLPAFYEAYRAFSHRLNDPANRIEFRLGPGDLVVFDNQRVLHGRSAYTIGHRHLQGCYADKDALNSTIRVLAMEHPA